MRRNMIGCSFVCALSFSFQIHSSVEISFKTRIKNSTDGKSDAKIMARKKFLYALSAHDVCTNIVHRCWLRESAQLFVLRVEALFNGRLQSLYSTCLTQTPSILTEAVEMAISIVTKLIYCALFVAVIDAQFFGGYGGYGMMGYGKTFQCFSTTQHQSHQFFLTLKLLSFEIMTSEIELMFYQIELFKYHYQMLWNIIFSCWFSYSTIRIFISQLLE